jgi:hypothetical protein
MKVVVLKDLPWDTSRGDVAKAVHGNIVEEYGRHILFSDGQMYHCVLLVPGNGNVDADRRPPHLLIDIDTEPDPACDESQFSYAMQDEVRSVRNTIARIKAEAERVKAIRSAIFYPMNVIRP